MVACNRPMAGPWTNPCGGVRWRNLADGTIEIEGQGVVMPPPGEGPYSLRTYVRNSWRNFETEIKRAASKHGVPANWIVAIIATETGLYSGSREKQLRAESYCCRGPMAVMWTPHPNHTTFGGYTDPTALYEAWPAIDTGTAIMKHYMVKQGLDLPQISARYNSGGLCCKTSPAVPSKPGGRVQNEFNLCSAKIADISYPMMSTMMNNFAVRELGVGPGGGWVETLLYTAGGIALFGAAGLLAVSLWSGRG